MDKKSNVSKLIQTAHTRFLKSTEVELLFENIENCDEYSELSTYVIENRLYKPKVPFFGIFMNKYDSIKDLSKNTKWKEDGYEYEKRSGRDNRGIKEFKQILRSKGNKSESIIVYYSKGFMINSSESLKFQQTKFQRRIYIKKNLNKFIIIQYHQVSEEEGVKTSPYMAKSINKNVKGDLNVFKSSKIGFKCYTNKIVDFCPRISELKGGDSMIIVLKQAVSSQTIPEVYFGSTVVKGSFLNPYSIKVKIPEMKFPLIINLRVFIDNYYFLTNKSLYFEFKKSNIKEKNWFVSAKNVDRSFTNLLYSDNDLESLSLSSADDNPKDLTSPDVFNLLKNDSNHDLSEEIFDKVKLIQKVVRGWIKRKNYSLLKRTAITLQKNFKHRS